MEILKAGMRIIFFLFVFLSSCTTDVAKQKANEFYILDMVHNNPAEPPTQTSFNNPAKLHGYGYNGMVLNNFKFVHASINYESFDSTIFPKGSHERRWVDQAAEELKIRISECHNADLKVYCFMDIAVLPKKLVEKYKEQLCDNAGKISFEKPFTIEIHREMLREVFQTFPDLDGLVIRTGETYLFNVPYHTGNNPITNGPESHIKLINILREEVCEKLNKMVFYRTWDFGFFHVSPEYYLSVTNKIQPHKNLIFSIKHTEGDYHRTFRFNPTLVIGKHKQIVEVQCQREYEGKGAHPNYVMDGVLNGFEEYNGATGNKSLNDIKNNPLFAGIWSWSRGGGWVGPYITNELWCDLNAFVISAWAQNPDKPEEEIFAEYGQRLGLSSEDRIRFRDLCLLSAKGVLRGHNSIIHPVNVWWTRDQFLGGLDLLDTCFRDIVTKGLVDAVIAEKQECIDIWKEIKKLSGLIKTNDSTVNEYIVVSAEYGLKMYSIVHQAWIILLKGMEGDISGKYDFKTIQTAISTYDDLWIEFNTLKKENPSCASLYMPYSFVFEPPDFHKSRGMDESVNRYREKIALN